MPLPLIPLIGMALSAAPTIAKWIGGDDAAKVTGEIASAAKGIFGTEDPAEVEKKIAADPAAYTAWQIRLAEIAADREKAAQEAAKAERQAELDALVARLEDTQSARSQTVDLAKAGSPIAWGAPLVSVIVTVGYFVILYLIIVKPFKLDDNMKDVTLFLLGALQIGFGQVVNYWLGSSNSSAAKDRMLHAVAQR